VMESRASAAAPADAQGLLTLLIADRIDQADSAFSLDLTLPDGSGLPPWSPGSHVDVVLPITLTRQYGLCGSTEPDAPWRICVQREVYSRGGSASPAANAQPGQTLQLRMPRNNFPLLSASRYRFVAGGIGITALLPMARELIAAGKTRDDALSPLVSAEVSQQRRCHGDSAVLRSEAITGPTRLRRPTHPAPSGPARKRGCSPDAVLVTTSVEQQTGAHLPRHETSMPVDLVTRASDGLPVRRP
jgi:hypothetical protein